MDHQPASIDFAFIGHQESWSMIMQIINQMRRKESLPSLSLSTVMDLYSFIPPRVLFELEFKSLLGQTVKGVYIESFIPPSDHGASLIQKNSQRVRDACQLAASLGAGIVALGGQTSILLENTGLTCRSIGKTFFTTGNTLTAAMIVRSIESAISKLSISLRNSKVLIIGSTGDIGSACARYFAGKVRCLLLNARREYPLRTQEMHIKSGGHCAKSSIHLEELLPEADIIISVTSSEIDISMMNKIAPGAMILDAGYPKNLKGTFGENGLRVIDGGLGFVSGGFCTIPRFYKSMYSFARAGLAHGCLLEAVVLALEKRFETFSAGRGNIRLESMEEINKMAEKHGIIPGPPWREGISRWSMTDGR